MDDKIRDAYMPKYQPKNASDKVFLLFLIAVLLLAASPVTTWWATGDNPWYIPYLIWLFIIALTLWMQRWRRQGSGEGDDF